MLVEIPAFVHTLAVVLHDPPEISSPTPLWVDIGLSWWFDFIATASNHLVNLTIELSFFPATTDFQLWGMLDTIAFPHLERLNIVVFDSHGREHSHLEDRLVALKRRGILNVSFQVSNEFHSSQLAESVSGSVDDVRIRFSRTDR